MSEVRQAGHRRRLSPACARFCDSGLWRATDGGVEGRRLQVRLAVGRER